MDRQRWDRIQSLFHDAATRPQSERQAFLQQECGADLELIQEVELMLRADGEVSPVLDTGLANIAYLVLDAPEESLPVSEVGPYRLKQVLGKGGMGVVCLAEREDTGALVAIKFLQHGAISMPRLKSFALEIKTLAKLRHRFIARLYDAGALADGTPWFVMEYIDGLRLTDYCAREHIPLRQKIDLFRYVCEAVQHAYRQGIIHRDLKPSNILVEKDGTPRLLDFGIAKQLQNLDDSDQTPTVLRLGSAEYGAPEWLERGIAGAFNDVYSLGVILYEMFAGRRPADSHADLPHLPELKADWDDLNALCLKSRHQDVSHRYQSVEELMRDVDRYLNCKPVEARGGGSMYRARKFVNRNSRAVVAAGLVFSVLAALIVFYTVRLTKAKNAALEEAARTRRIQGLLVDLISGGEKVSAPSSDLRVVTLLDRGAQEAKRMHADPDTQAELALTLGEMYTSLADFPKADEMVGFSLQIRKTTLGMEDPKTAEALVQMGILHGDEARFDDAERLIRQGLDIARRHLPPRDPDVVEAQSRLGRVLAQRGETDQAIALLDPLVRQSPEGERETLLWLESLTALAYAQHDAGHFDVSESLNRRALALDRRLHGNSSPRVANDLVNIGSAQLSLRQLPAAENSYREAIAIDTEWWGPHHPDVVMMRSLLARTLTQEGKYVEADTLLREVLSEQQQAFGPNHPYVAFTLDTLGRIARNQGKPKEAEADFTRALAIDTTAFGATHIQTASVSEDLAGILVERKQYPAAEALLRAALQGITSQLPASSVRTAQTQIKLGDVLLKQGRCREAEPFLSAGYATLLKQPNAVPDLIPKTRTELIAVYEGLHQDDKARQLQRTP